MSFEEREKTLSASESGALTCVFLSNPIWDRSRDGGGRSPPYVGEFCGSYIETTGLRSASTAGISAASVVLAIIEWATIATTRRIGVCTSLFPWACEMLRWRLAHRLFWAEASVSGRQAVWRCQC